MVQKAAPLGLRVEVQVRGHNATSDPYLSLSQEAAIAGTGGEPDGHDPSDSTLPGNETGDTASGHDSRNPHDWLLVGADGAAAQVKEEPFDDLTANDNDDPPAADMSGLVEEEGEEEGTTLGWQEDTAEQIDSHYDDTEDDQAIASLVQQDEILHRSRRPGRSSLPTAQQMDEQILALAIGRPSSSGGPLAPAGPMSWQNDPFHNRYKNRKYWRRGNGYHDVDQRGSSEVGRISMPNEQHPPVAAGAAVAGPMKFCCFYSRRGNCRRGFSCPNIHEPKRRIAFLIERNPGWGLTCERSSSDPQRVCKHKILGHHA